MNARRGLWPLCLTVIIHFFLVRLFTGPYDKMQHMQDRHTGSLTVLLITQPKLELLKPRAHRATMVVADRTKPARSYVAETSVPQLDPAPLTSISDQTSTVPTVNAYQIIEQAKRDIPKIDKETRGPTNLLSGESENSLSKRLARGIESAFVGDAPEVTSHYTAPDGVVYTRITRGSRSRCYMSGAGNYVSQAATGSGWRPVNCPPADSGWVK